MKNFYRNTMESKVESTRSFLQNEVFSIYYAYSFTTIRYSTTCSKAFMIFVCHWKRKPLKLPLYMNLCILVQKNSKQTLLWTLFISFEFQKRKFQVTFHVKLLKWILLIISFFLKKLWSGVATLALQDLFNRKAKEDDGKIP